MLFLCNNPLDYLQSQLIMNFFDESKKRRGAVIIAAVVLLYAITGATVGCSSGEADIVNGKISLGDAKENLTISDKYDLDKEFSLSCSRKATDSQIAI